jgi:acyl-CoA synthetase (AMP-forming)/AMP-acid ligase II
MSPASRTAAPPIAGTARVSYRRANRLANALLAAGCSGKDRVLVVCENSVEAVIVKLGVQKAGLVVAPVNPSLAADVIEDGIRRIAPRLAIVDAEVWPRVEAAFARAGVAVAVTVPITAVVMRKPGTEAGIEPVSEADLIAFCRARLAGFETPKRVVFVEKYPETVGGKVLKHVLRAELGGR